MKNKIIIGGLGSVGLAVTKRLLQYDCEVVVVDINDKIFKKYSGTIEAKFYTGDIRDTSLLKEINVENGILLSLTNDDDANILASSICLQKFGIKKAITRINNSFFLTDEWRDFCSSRNHLFSPYNVVAQHLVNSINLLGAKEAYEVFEDSGIIFSVICEKEGELTKISIEHLEKIVPVDIKIFAYRDEHGVHVIDKSQTLSLGQHIFVYAEKRNAAAAIAIFKDSLELERVVIWNGDSNNIAEEFAIACPDINLTIVEKNYEYARMLAKISPDITVMKGDLMERELLDDLDMKKLSALLAVTDNDHTNVLTALLAKEFGAKYVGALVRNSCYYKVLRSLNVDMIVDPLNIIVSDIITNMYSAHIKKIYSLQESKAEIVEVWINKHSPYVGCKAGDLKKETQAEILTILRLKEQITMNLEDIELNVDDRIILFLQENIVSVIDKL